MTPAERRIADDILAHSLDLFRVDAHLRNDILKLLKSLEKELTAKLAAGTLTEYSKAATDFLLAQTKTIIADYYDRIQEVTDKVLSGIPSLERAAITAALTDVGFGASLAAPTHFAVAATDILIQGAPSAEWWSRQSEATAFKFSNEVRRGIVQGETNQQIIARIVGKQGFPGIMPVARHNAAALVQTSVQTVANVARLETFRQNADIVKGLKQVSTLDSHTTDICMAYSGAEWNLDEEPIGETDLPFNGGPPRHWNCRSVLIPITKSLAELGIDVPDPASETRASMDGPVSGSMTFDAFLKRKGEAFQDEMLGKGRAELWRDGKITLPQLLDLRGNPLSLDQLRAKYVD